MSGFGYTGGPGQIIDTEAVKEPIPERKVSQNQINKKAERAVNYRNKKSRIIRGLKSKRAQEMEESLLKQQAAAILQQEKETAQLAGTMVAGMLSAKLAKNPGIIASHPEFRKIETELILTRGADFEGMCRRWDIRTPAGELAVRALALHYGRMRERYSRLFDVLDRTAKEKLAESYLNKVNEVYDLAKGAHSEAMQQLAFVKDADGSQTPYFAPDYEAAAVMLEKMLAATNLIGSAMEREKEAPEASQGPGPTYINGPVGRVQILGLPKAIPQKSLPAKQA